MSVMVIRCTNTGKPVSTGIEVEPASFADLPEVVATMNCPRCGFEHLWLPSRAWLEEIEPAVEPRPS